MLFRSMEVDIPRKRVGLSMRMSDTPGEKAESMRGAGNNRSGQQNRAERVPAKPETKPAPANNAMAALFANAKNLRK